MKPVAAAASILALLLSTGVPPARAHHPGHSGHSAPGAAEMSDAEMKQAVEAWYAAHPRIGSQGTSGLRGTSNRIEGVDAVVQVGGTQFNHDGNGSTQIDTVRIMVGQTVRWVWNDGFHTLTSGTGFDDPNMGLVFDQAIDMDNTSFEFTFTTAEIVPYFCQPHEFFDMKGVVVVSEPVGAPSPSADATIGFVAAPWPNPTSTGVQFRFRLTEPGHVRVDVVDAKGRHVATVLDRGYEAGTYASAWDGIGTTGRRVPAGHYYLRLRVPGFVGGRPFVITR
jgi:plastocyanin